MESLTYRCLNVFTVIYLSSAWRILVRWSGKWCTKQLRYIQWWNKGHRYTVNWIQKHFVRENTFTNSIKWTGIFRRYNVATRSTSLRTPCEFFSHFVTDVFLTEVAYQTNLYASQSKPQKQFQINIIDLKKFIGILLFMSVHNYPNVRSYWGRYAFTPLQSVMTLNRFEEIRSMLHFADNTQMQPKDHPDYDVLYKIRPIVKHFNNRFGTIPMIQPVPVDEMMCSTKMSKTNLKQYMPNKPHKWGFKFFVLCDVNGFCHTFEIYTGKLSQVISLRSVFFIVFYGK